MIIPVLDSWIKQASFDASLWIIGGHKVSLEHVAPYAGKAQIAKRSFAFTGQWNNMVDFHRDYDRFLSLAILALSSRPFIYLLSQSFGDPYHALCPKFEQSVDVMPAPLQLQQSLGAQKYLVIKLRNQVLYLDNLFLSDLTQLT